MGAILALSGCASATTLSGPVELIVEGNAASYPAFLEAAEACDLTTFEEVSDGAGGTHVHLYLAAPAYPLSAPARCALQWIDEHPELGLVVSGH